MEDNSQLVDYLVDEGHVNSSQVEEAFRSVDRKDFVPEKHRSRAYEDQAIPINQKATVSAPHMVATSTELLEVEEEETVLEIGSGSGYQAAILSELAEKVVGIEFQEKIARESREKLADRENVEIRTGNGFKAVHRDEVFDSILFSCAVDSVGEARKHLDEDGTIVAPVKQNGLQILKRFRKGNVTEHGRVRFVDFIED